jgi:release factor glutamine methyltransferase
MEKVGNILTYFKTALANRFDEREISSWAYLSINHILGFSKSDCILRRNESLTEATQNQFLQIVEELKSEKPIQYILRVTDFYGLTLKVNKNVLIPRPETEELVHWILQNKFASALDIGTGSGCIAISLAKNTAARISAIDVSNKALKVAEENAKSNGVVINFFQKNIFKTTSLEKVDIK